MSDHAVSTVREEFAPRQEDVERNGLVWRSFATTTGCGRTFRGARVL